MTPSEYNQIKENLKAEILRRRGPCPITEYSTYIDRLSSAPDAESGTNITEAQGKAVVDTYLMIRTDGDLKKAVKGEPIPKYFDEMETLITRMASKSPTDSSDCRATCTGLCTNHCYSDCAGCTSTCTKSCATDCSGNCVTGCTASGSASV